VGRAEVERMSVQEYLDTEPLSEERREYLDGLG